MPRSRASLLSAAIERFREAHEHVLKALTMRSYMGSLMRFQNFVGPKATVADLDPENVDRYIASVADHRYMARNDCAVLRVFARWCEKAGYTQEDQLRSVRSPKVPKWRPKALPRSTADRAMELAGEHPTLGLRDRAIVMLSLDTGARPNEIRQLRYPDDVDLDRRLIQIREETSKTASGHRRVPISPQVANVVREYVERDRPEKSGPLFLNAHGDPFSYYGFLEVHHRLTKALRSEGIMGYTAYSLRHTAITAKAKALPTLVVQKLAGHKSIVTTQNYVGDLTDDDLLRMPDIFSQTYGRVG